MKDFIHRFFVEKYEDKSIKARISRLKLWANRNLLSN